MAERGETAFAVICAHNPGRRNLGMYSVDLAARDFFAGLGRPYQMVKLVGHTRVGDVAFRKVSSSSELLAYRNIVFWGDFQQNPIWGRKNFSPRAAKDYGLSQEAAFKLWRQLCLFEDIADLTAHNVYSVGTCFLGLRNELEQGGLGDAYRRLLSRFRTVVPRDHGSFAELRRLGLTNIVEGFDCASLLARHSPVRQPSGGRFAYAFGRTLSAVQARSLVAELRRLTGSRPLPVKWLLNKMIFGGPARRYEAAIRSIQEADFVVTDIYHLAINAMKLGKRVFCIAEMGEDFSDTCDDYKKSILMETVGRQDDLIDIPDAGAADPHEIACRIADQIGKPGEYPSAAGFDAATARYRAILEGLFSAAPYRPPLFPGTMGA